jgi:hypothetical protein
MYSSTDAGLRQLRLTVFAKSRRCRMKASKQHHVRVQLLFCSQQSQQTLRITKNIATAGTAGAVLHLRWVGGASLQHVRCW